MKIISFMNMKGGVGKTTSALNLAYGLAQKGKKVILIDLDAQGNSSQTVLNQELAECTIKELILNPTTETLNECLKESNKYEDGNISIIPANPTLFGLSSKILADTTHIPQYRLKAVIDLLPYEYDYCIIDNAPIIDILTINSLLVSDLTVVPTTADLYAREGTKQTIDNYNQLKRTFNLGYKPRVLLTLMARNKASSTFAEDMRSREDVDVFDTQIRYQAKPISDTNVQFQIVCRENLYKNSGIAQDYNKFVMEILELFEPDTVAQLKAQEDTSRQEALNEWVEEKVATTEEL